MYRLILYFALLATSLAEIFNPTCGIRNPNGVDVDSIGDVSDSAYFGEFPWMVAVFKSESVNASDPSSESVKLYLGGGSLIHPSVVLTAAHFLTQDMIISVRAGEWDTQTTKEIHPHQDRDVRKIEINSGFNKKTLFFDVALLFLSAPIKKAPNVALVCLPPPQEDQSVRRNCFVSGWGKDKGGKDGQYQVTLKKIGLPVVNRGRCQDALQRTRLGNKYKLHPSFMCAGGNGRDACEGDGGSPLVCPTGFVDNRYEQAGIVSWSPGCGQIGTPGVYVDVTHVRPWIDDKVTREGYVVNGNFTE